MAMHWVSGVQMNTPMHVDHGRSVLRFASARNRSRKIWQGIAGECKVCFVKGNVSAEDDTARW